MESDHIARLAYLLLLGGVIATWFLLQNRRRLGQLAQQAAIWGLIFLGAIAGYGLWTDIRRDVAPHLAMRSEPGQVSLPRAVDGHYYLTLRIGDTPVRFMVDTGATHMVLAQSDARKIGIDPARLEFRDRAMTANGEVRIAPVVLPEVSLGGRTDRDVRAWVSEGGLGISLLGMSYLNRFERIEITGREMLLSW